MKKIFKKIRLLMCVTFFVNLFCFSTVFGVSNTNEKLNEDSKVSIVIPVYNVEKYIDECLNSVESQTYKNLEIICVNDGSKDGSLEKLKQHQKKDSRIKIIDQENKGVSAARNAGMDAATGEYLFFLDSDDLMLPFAIEKILETAKKYDADVVRAQHDRFEYNQKANIKKYKYQNLDSKVCELKEGENPFNFFNLAFVVWNRLFKRSFLTSNNIRFKEGIIMEDFLFLWDVKVCLKTLIIDNNTYYLYRKGRPGSILNAEFKKLKKCLNSRIEMIERMSLARDKVNFKDKDNYIARSMLDSVYKTITVKLKGDSEQKKYATKAVSEIEKNFIKKYNIHLDKENLQKLNDLKRLSK